MTMVTRFQNVFMVIPAILLLIALVPNMQHSVGVQEPDSGYSNSTSSQIRSAQESLGLYDSVIMNHNTPQSICASLVDKQTWIEIKSINLQQAKLLATTNIDFQSKIKGYDNAFDSIFVKGSIGPSCLAVWNDIDVVYDLTDSKGQYVKHLVVKEDPLLNAVLDVSEQKGKGRASVTYTTTNWSGYEFYYNQVNGTRYPVWETNSSWSVPAISYPTNAQVTPVCEWTTYPTCDTSVWIGLENTVGATNSDLVQGGSDSNMTCISSTNCTKHYSIWYEFLNNPSVNNGNMIWCDDTVHPGDTITSLINDTTRNSNSNSSNYVISIQDISNSTDTVCGATNQGDSMNMPSLAAFIVERHSVDGNSLTLANFSSITMAGTMYYNNSYHSIQVPTNAGYYYQTLMEN